MGQIGRPPKPIEEKRRLGNPGKRRLPAIGSVVHLPMAIDVPDAPGDLGLEGHRMWEGVWSNGLMWISPASDSQAVEDACRLADDVAKARERYRVTGDPADGRIVAALSREFRAALSELGFNPTARSRLGVAEVTRVSKLEALRRKADA